MAGGEGYISHYEAVRLRVRGEGLLRMRWYSMDDVKTKILAPLTMIASTNKELVRKTNFQQQRAKLEIKTSAIDEHFLISKIVVYAKPVAESYPQ